MADTANTFTIVLQTLGILGGVGLTGVITYAVAVRNNKTTIEVTHIQGERQYTDNLQEDVKNLKEEVWKLKARADEWQSKWFEVKEARLLDQQKIADNERKITDLTEKYVKQKQDYEEMLTSLQNKNVEMLKECEDQMQGLKEENKVMKEENSTLRAQVERHTQRLQFLESIMRKHGVPIPPEEGPNG